MSRRLKLAGFAGALALNFGALVGLATEVRGEEPETLEERVERLEKLVGEEPSPNEMFASWAGGLSLQTLDKRFRIQIGGRIDADFVWIDEDRDIDRDVGDQEDQASFRRARIYIKGDVYDNVFFMSEYDFAEGDADFTDVFVGLKNLPVIGKVRVGHFKEPFSLEQEESGNTIPFMERATLNVFVPVRNTGINVYNTCSDERIFWSVSAVRDADTFGDSHVESQGAVTARVSGLPVYEDDGKTLVHVGGAFTHRALANDEVRFRQRPEVQEADRFVDTGTIPAETVDQFALEAATVLGRFSAQGEYIWSDVDAEQGRDPTFSGFYAFVSVFLTDHHRGYKKSAGHFSWIEMEKTAFARDKEKSSIGAVELALRYSHLDLNDAGIRGGKLDDFTLGANWYLNPHTRIMLNLVRSDLDGSGEATALALRFHIDF